MPATYNILIMGASYGSLLASKLLFGVPSLCNPDCPGMRRHPDALPTAPAPWSSRAAAPVRAGICIPVTEISAGVVVLKFLLLQPTNAFRNVRFKDRTESSRCGVPAVAKFASEGTARMCGRSTRDTGRRGNHCRRMRES